MNERNFELGNTMAKLAASKVKVKRNGIKRYRKTKILNGIELMMFMISGVLGVLISGMFIEEFILPGLAILFSIMALVHIVFSIFRNIMRTNHAHERKVMNMYKRRYDALCR